MKKILLTLISLTFSTSVCLAVPSNSISIPNSFSPNTVISSSQMNSNFNEAATKYNAHNHTDITSLGTITTGVWNATAVTSAYTTVTLDDAYDDGKTITADNGAIVINKTDATVALDINKTGTGEGTVIDIDNNGTGHSVYISQDLGSADTRALRIDNGVSYGGVRFQQGADLASNTYLFDLYSSQNFTKSNAALAYFNSAGATSAAPTVEMYNAGTEATLKLNTTNAAGAPLFIGLRSSSTYATEGGIYADTEDGVLYYRSSSNWAACNADTDYSETFGIKGNINSYKEGDVVVISSEPVSQEKKDKIKQDAKIKEYDGRDEQGNVKYKTVHSDRKETRLFATALKVEQSSSPYQTNVLGVISFRSVKNWVSDDEIPVGLLGKVKCNVTNENGPIATGDLLTTSSTKGYAMKATIDSFDKIGSIIGKARESFTDNKGQIEIVVGK